MLKLFGAVMVLCACGYAGFSMARNYQQRPKELRCLQSALQMLETEISYGATPLPDALEQVARRSESSVAGLFALTREQLLNGEGITAREAWDEALKQFYRSSAIKAGDAAVLKALGAGLGISDREDQVKHLRLAREQLKIETAKAEEEAVRNVKLYNYLGFLGGLTIVLILI
ncbi:stage III sporulation protein AB [Desulfohalotomaculum tongense]|uniref:stage III sporulation protein SpoIIIAB n=1 Tax=Desulforadius tongensis TaxID=1216062 RepID=UPI001957ABDC|nr:stage III sporulation protein SpoIIIAB [Desulforadius tongensis]MBM7855480.1 stage III sporulation protein AB [Desulforadius tongensis]